MERGDGKAEGGGKGRARGRGGGRRRKGEGGEWKGGYPPPNENSGYDSGPR